MTLIVVRNTCEYPRLGVAASRKLGVAVHRNRAKRLFRELARQVRRQLTPGRDLLVFPRHGALAATHQALRDAWLTALRQQALVHSSDEG